jgi:hypothetical protein
VTRRNIIKNDNSSRRTLEQYYFQLGIRKGMQKNKLHCDCPMMAWKTSEGFTSASMGKNTMLFRCRMNLGLHQLKSIGQHLLAIKHFTERRKEEERGKEALMLAYLRWVEDSKATAKNLPILY